MLHFMYYCHWQIAIGAVGTLWCHYVRCTTMLFICTCYPGTRIIRGYYENNWCTLTKLNLAYIDKKGT